MVASTFALGLIRHQRANRHQHNQRLKDGELMVSEHESTGPTGRATELSEDVIEALEDSGRAAIGAVRGFLATVEEAIPQGEGVRKVERQITDSALEMAEQLVHTQADFLRRVLGSAAKSRSSTEDKK